MWLTRFALSRPIITAMVFIALVLFGFIAFLRLGRSLNPPGTTFPVVVVVANYPGASPAEMEKLIVKPIEDQLSGIDGMDQVSALAQEGQATVVVQFRLGTDLDTAAIDVQRRVDTARVYMPADLDPPYVFKNGSQMPLLDLAVSSRSLSPEALAQVVDDRLKPLLEQIPDVQTVDVYGEARREFQVLPDPARLLAVDGTLSDLFAAVEANNPNLPGGILRQPEREASVQIGATVTRARDLLAVPLTIPGGTMKGLTVGDVATAVDGHAERTTISTYDGVPRLYVSLSRKIGSDEIAATADARRRLALIEKQFPQLSFHEIDAPADYTAAALGGVWQSLIEGIVLTAIVMLLFLHAWRNAAVVLIAIPTSIFSTFIVMKLLGFHLDLMSLMGLSLIIGILVDDSIVVLENITRHREMGKDPITAAVDGRTEIGGAAIAITMVDVVVFLPIAFLPGIVGAFLREFGAVVVIATLFSLFVSFTLTPLLAGRWSVRTIVHGRPRWMDVLGTKRVNVGLALLAAVCWFAPWIFVKVAGILLAALIVLNAFVQRYDAVTRWYRTRALPAALRHGYFLVFLCAMLYWNAVLLLAGGTVAAVFDVLVAAVLAAALGLAPLARRRAAQGRLQPIPYAAGCTTVARILAAHAVAALPVHGPVPFALQRNALRFVVRAIAGMSLRSRITRATFAIPLVLAIAMPLLGKVETDFVPSMQTGEITMTLTYPPGTPLHVTAERVQRLVRGILAIPGIRSVSATAGQKPFGYEDLTGGNYAELHAQVAADQRNRTDAIIERIRQLSSLVPGADLQVSGESGSGSGVALSYALMGPESEIGPAADRVAAYLRSLPGTVNVTTSLESGAPQVSVRIDPARCDLLGVSPGAAATAARLALDGGVATRVRTSTGLVDVRVQLPRRFRTSLTTLENVRVRAADGTLVPLEDVADFSWTVAPTAIQRLDRQRIVTVTSDLLPGYSLGAITGPLEKKLREPGFLPPGVVPKPQGDAEYMIETMQSMGIALLTSFVLVYMLMVILYGSFVEPLIVMFSVPLALIGALMALAVTHAIAPENGQSLNLISMIGIVMLFGLVAKNGILLVDYSNTLCRRGLHVEEAVLEASATRLRPILMTTCAMVFGMLPLALGFTEGAEWRQSMGTVLIGGLLSSLILTLFLVPMIYHTWMGFAQRLADRRAVEREGLPVPVTA
jgi:multidrug efflux pump subunit AcrB